MKAITVKWRYNVYLIGLLIVTTLYTSSCHNSRQSVERITQNEMQCEMAVQMTWGEGISDLGYVSGNESSIRILIPPRFQIDSTGSIYVTDPQNERILEFSTTGDFIRSFTVPVSKDVEFIEDVAIGGNRIAVATTDHIYIFDQEGKLLQTPKWPANVGDYGLCSEDAAGRRVQVDEKGNIYACGVGGYERGGTIVQFDDSGYSRIFYAGAFDHVVIGRDGLVYITQLGNTETATLPPNNRVLQFDLQGNQLGEITISGRDLADAGLAYPGLLIAVDGKGNLYGDVVNAFEGGAIVPFNALTQISKEGKILRIVEHDKFIRPVTDIVDKEGNLYVWNMGEVPFEPVEIWRCHF